MNCLVRFLLFLELVYFVIATPTTINAPPVSENIISHERDDLRDLFGHCLHKKNVSKCLKHRVINVIDDVIQSDDPMTVNLFNINMSLKKNPSFKKEVDNVIDTSRSFEDVISQKLKSLLDSRIVQVKLAEEPSQPPQDENEARKKKGGGGKHGMMMSGMALVAFLGQLFLSKVAFMSGAALILAKIALLFSALTSLKKSSHSGGGEHVVYAAEVSKGQGWQRSIHSDSPHHQLQQENSDDLTYRGHSTMPSYDGVPGTINAMHRTGAEYSESFL